MASTRLLASKLGFKASRTESRASDFSYHLATSSRMDSRMSDAGGGKMSRNSDVIGPRGLGSRADDSMTKISDTWVGRKHSSRRGTLADMSQHTLGSRLASTSTTTTRGALNVASHQTLKEEGGDTLPSELIQRSSAGSRWLPTHEKHTRSPHRSVAAMSRSRWQFVSARVRRGSKSPASRKGSLHRKPSSPQEFPSQTEAGSVMSHRSRRRSSTRAHSPNIGKSASRDSRVSSGTLRQTSATSRRISMGRRQSFAQHDASQSHRMSGARQQSSSHSRLQNRVLPQTSSQGQGQIASLPQNSAQGRRQSVVLNQGPSQGRRPNLPQSQGPSLERRKSVAFQQKGLYQNQNTSQQPGSESEDLRGGDEADISRRLSGGFTDPIRAALQHAGSSALRPGLASSSDSRRSSMALRGFQPAVTIPEHSPSSRGEESFVE